MTDAIPLTHPSGGERELAAVAEVFFAGQGPQGQALEAELAHRFGAGAAFAVHSPGDALHLALRGLGVGPGDEVIVADYALPAPAHAVRRAGAVPVLADVRADTGTVDPWAVADLIGPRTAGVIAVDTAGLPADYTELEWITDRHGLFLVEDATCAAGASYKGRSAGALAPVACLSGAPNGEGGEGAVLLTRDPAFATARTRSGTGRTLSDRAAAILRIHLARTAELLQRRHAVAARYTDLLTGDGRLAPPHVPQNRTHAWHSYLVTLHPGVDRTAVVAGLRAQGIGCGPGPQAAHLPTSAALARHTLALPMHAELTLSQIERVTEALLALIS
ncbi:DegT/DnrJ/EryC1/StrS family aminotransferase [Streptomyces roseirectus]|uniref:DegT/DnrJ/EryC1/StrS family aminotransferase n=1 Tax=Streptomyces roseirectus TaxID=2768066 RepID=A0A7H0IPN4_9ACTN|nr:DegT/DnrJ/EryC1/StrS family aminotransferase [Streptomyces roseirectus]QNP74750.1 DegT/DnrJ/EryC1/StrS family aminotransferase [Streptomyces roseirectus]